VVPAGVGSDDRVRLLWPDAAANLFDTLRYLVEHGMNLWSHIRAIDEDLRALGSTQRKYAEPRAAR
jgi:hypothetical protein